MAFFNSAVDVLQTLVVALGAGLGIWGAINLLEGYGNDNPGAKSQGMKQLMAGGGVALIGITLVWLPTSILTSWTMTAETTPLFWSRPSIAARAQNLQILPRKPQQMPDRQAHQFRR